MLKCNQEICAIRGGACSRLEDFTSMFIACSAVTAASNEIKDNYDKSRARIAFGYSYCSKRLFRETK